LAEYNAIRWRGDMRGRVIEFRDNFTRRSLERRISLSPLKWLLNSSVTEKVEPKRCSWAKGELYIQYHDEEWGVPQHDERALFELLILEGAQAGLSWSTILAKRENYRKAFDKL